MPELIFVLDWMGVHVPLCPDSQVNQSKLAGTVGINAQRKVNELIMKLLNHQVHKKTISGNTSKKVKINLCL